MKTDNLGPTQKKVLQALSDLEWWTIKQVSNVLCNSGAEKAVSRLYDRGFVEKRTGRGLPFHHELRLTLTGIDAYLSQETTSNPITSR